MENPPIPIGQIPYIEVNLKMCTLYKGIPYGLAHIDGTGTDYGFEAYGFFTNG